MACFLVPAAEAVVTTVATKIIEKKELTEVNEITINENKEKLSTKLHRLNNLLWGGTALLAFEHVWHGEVTPFFPFLTAAGNPADTAEMISEMSTVGVTMAVLVTAVWAVTNVATAKILKKNKTVA